MRRARRRTSKADDDSAAEVPSESTGVEGAQSAASDAAMQDKPRRRRGLSNAESQQGGGGPSTRAPAGLPSIDTGEPRTPRLVDGDDGRSAAAGAGVQASTPLSDSRGANRKTRFDEDDEGEQQTNASLAAGDSVVKVDGSTQGHHSQSFPASSQASPSENQKSVRSRNGRGMQASGDDTSVGLVVRGAAFVEESVLSARQSQLRNQIQAKPNGSSARGGHAISSAIDSMGLFSVRSNALRDSAGMNMGPRLQDEWQNCQVQHEEFVKQLRQKHINSGKSADTFVEPLLNQPALLNVDGSVASGESAFTMPFVRPRQLYDENYEYLHSVMMPPTSGEAQSKLKDLFSLEVVLSHVVLLNHPQFSDEERLAARLLSLHRHWAMRRKLGWRSFWDGRVRALQQSAEAKLNQQRLDSESALNPENVSSKPMSSSVHEKHWQGVLDIETQLQSALLQTAQAEHEEAMLVRRMIAVWKDVKLARKKQGFASSSVKLQLIKRSTDQEKDQARLDQQAEAEANARHRVHKARFEKELAKHKRLVSDMDIRVTFLKERVATLQDKLHAAESAPRRAKTFVGGLLEDDGAGSKLHEHGDVDTPLRRRGTRKRKEVGQNAEEGEGGAGGNGPVAQDSNDSSDVADVIETLRQRLKEEEQALHALLEKAESMQEPKYVKLDHDELLQQARIKQSKMQRRPGEPEFEPVVDENGYTISADTDVPSEERRRRERSRKAMLSARVVVDGVIVTRIDNFPLHGMRADFGSVICTQLHGWPNTVRIDVLMPGRLGDIPVGSVHLPVGPGAPPTGDYLDALQFASVAQDSSSGVGGGSDGALPPGSVQGTMFVRSGWINAMAPPGAPADAVHRQREIRRKLEHRDGGEGDLSQWLARRQLDPNDPDNADILELLAGGENTGDVLNLFRLNMGSESLEWKNVDQKRFKLMEVRYKSGMVDMQVPMIDSEIDEDVYFKTINAESEKARTAAMRVEAAGDRAMRRRHVASLLARMAELKAQILGKKSSLSKQTTFSDIVQEAVLPDIRLPAILDAIKAVFAKRSKLKPQYKERKPVAVRKDGDCNIVIQVARGHGFPSRVQSEQGNVKEEPSQLVVEARFQSSVACTPAVPGPHPQWNVPLKLPVRPPRDEFSPSNLASMKDTLHINVFDNVTFSNSVDDDPSTKQVREERRWLGSVRLPWATLYKRMRIEGNFIVSMPGHFVSHAPTQDSSQSTLLNLYVTLDPPLVQPLEEAMPTPQLAPRLREVVEEWQANCARAKPPESRSFVAAGLSLDGQWTLLNRFIGPQKPPPGVDSISQMMRFVQLVPFLDDWGEEEGSSQRDLNSNVSIWCRSDEFLQLQAGDWEEHAVLLCNFFLHKGIESYVVCGKGIPEGPTVYVLARLQDSWKLVNASTGRMFEATDPQCTLVDIDVVVGQNNIWGNVQKETSLWRSTLNLNDAKAWRPLFLGNPPVEATQCVQIADILYSEPVSSQADVLQRDIRESIAAYFEEWRLPSITRWHRQTERVLNSILKTLEHNADQNKHSDINAEGLQTITSQYRMTGFCINRPFTETSALLQELEHSGIHITNPQEETTTWFAASVYVHPLPSKVMSVWVYVAALVRTDGHSGSLLPSSPQNLENSVTRSSVTSGAGTRRSRMGGGRRLGF